MTSLGLPIPHGVVLEAILKHADQPFTKLDFSKQIPETRSYLSAASQQDGTHDVIKTRATYAAAGRENTNSNDSVLGSIKRMRLAVDDAYRSGIPTMTPSELLELEVQAFWQPRSSNPPYALQRRCECGVPILYGNKHLNCSMSGNAK